uniref:Apple domain-containing protein n=1 Tax=Chromera velia CCMP2878 TaxID=1169474 RepID=A0A0G4G8J2_9ALVE|eukprot:Cvel_20634.t1-p1 / transcript=Cvel_20634.t1 / gene=Cvel_20634 / organism=Chromera_velia_CCMP2878 / gene_product=hypothetical protein / transcript_product=hypothetical protein / location=Cvel_scaffold1870:31377-32281(-) / protein_length=227 / sequence_SO=supercontig / SO=protein_coding / is_pseudo=false
MSLIKRVGVVLCLNALSAAGQLWSSPVGPGSSLSHGRTSSADCPLPCGPSGCCNYTPDQCAWDTSRGYHCTASTMFSPGGGSTGPAPSTPGSGFGQPAAPGGFGGAAPSTGGGMGMGGGGAPPTAQDPNFSPQPPAGTGTGGGLPRGYDGSQQPLGTCSIATPPVVTLHPDGSMTAVGRRRLRGAEASEIESAPQRSLAVSIQEDVTREQCDLNCVGNQNTCSWTPN